MDGERLDRACNGEHRRRRADPANDLTSPSTSTRRSINGDAFADVGPADASITFTDQDLAIGGFDPTPDPTLGALDDWDNISAGDVANGLAQFVASLAGSQGEGNGPLPFLKKSLTESETVKPLFDAVKPLTDYAALLTNAQVGCGTEPGDADSFPTGLTDNLADGTPVYCRARTQRPRDGSSIVGSFPSARRCRHGQRPDATPGTPTSTPTRLLMPSSP